MINAKFDPSIKSLLQELEGMQEGFGEKALNSALVAAASPVKKSIKANAPKESGALAKSIGHRKLAKRARAALGIKPGQVALYIGPTSKQVSRFRKKDGSYATAKRSQVGKAHMVEFGTKPHTIEPSKKFGKGRLFFQASGASIVARKVSHPGTKANPFIRRGWDQSDDQFGNRFYSGLTKFSEKKRATAA